MKAHTDLNQSKKLAEILPKESADMYYEKGIGNNCRIAFGNYADIDISKNLLHIDAIPCWSLAALLSVIPKHIKDYNVLRIDISDNDFAIWYDEIGYGVNNDLPNITMESAVDACYEMINKLHEQKIL